MLIKMFSQKKGFSTKFVKHMGFFNYLIKIQASFFLDLVQDDILEFDYSGNEIPAFCV